MDANGSANGTDYRRRAREARARVAALKLEAEARLLESWGVEPQPGYPTSWYDPFDAGRNWGLPPAWLWHGGGRDARADGADRPFVWHEVDLDRSRGLARWLAAKNLWAVGTLNTLTNYAVKTGFKWEATPAAGMEQDRTALVLARLAQRVIDEFSDLNTLPFWEREAFSSSRRDGECFYRFFGQDDGTTLLRPVLPEQVRQPLGSPASCTFGIETDPRDVLRPRYYYVDYEAGAPDGYARDDYEDVPAGEIAHLKLNVDAVVKRGLSDFYCCHESFDQLSKLLRNMATTAANQSAISWYEKYPNVSQDKLWELGARRRDLNRPGWTDPFSGRQPNFEKITPGEIRFLNGNAEIIPAPLAQNTNQHISILQACLRALGRRWDMPEYMASGDASNANYASTLVAGSPFVNAIECEQARYLVHFRRWQLAALRNAAAAGRFRLGGRAWAFEDVMRLVAVHGTPPAVAVANRQAEASQDLQDLAAGVTSLQVVRGKRGLDNAKIEQDLREQPPTRVVGRATDVDPSGNPVGPGGGVRESLLREGFTGTITDSIGRERHYVDGRQVAGPAETGAGRPGTAGGDPGGQYRHLGTRAPAFKEWFGDWEADPDNASKIVGKDGKPQQNVAVDGFRGEPVAYYHGTNADFDEFDTAGWAFFSPTRKYSQEYTDRDKILVCYLNVRKPIDLRQFPGEGEVDREEVHRVLTEEYGFDIDLDALGHGELHQVLEPARWEIRWEAEDKGYDGVIQNEVIRNMAIESVAVFKPEQVKSVGNQGTFDPGSPKIHESLLREGFTGTITDSLGRKIHYRDGKRVKVEGGPGAGHEEAAAAMRAAHPFPRGAMPASPPGSGRADLIAQDPALRQAEARRAEWVRQHHRAFVASAVDALLHGPPPAPLPPPDPAAPVARKAALARKAVRRLDDAAGTETMLGPAFESHARMAAAAHPGGPAALAAAREEAARRTADAARQLAGHLEGLAGALPDPAHRPLTRPDLSRGHLIDAAQVHPELREAVTALAAQLPHAEHPPSGLRLAVGDTPGAKAALAVLRDLGAARRPGEDEYAKEEVLRRLGGRLPPELRGGSSSK